MGSFQAPNFNKGFPFLFKNAPAGGSAARSPSGIARGAGHGGNGSCPHYGANIRNTDGWDGKPGLAVLQACTKQCSYILALQRCRPATSSRWTLRGLWPGGVANCAALDFNFSSSWLEKRIGAALAILQW